jgi:uncharacterized protein DUF3761
MRRPPVLVRLFAAALIGGAVLAGCGTPTDTPTFSPATDQLDTPVAPALVTSVPAPATLVAPPAPAEQTPVPQVPVVQPPVEAPPVAVPPADDGTDCGGDYYINSDGNCVHRPEQAPSAPSGATAKCNDGTYSFSKHHSGTCSSHGGVDEWL